MSAYACEPGKGSESGVGWNLATHMATYHRIWVITRSTNRSAIESELFRNPHPALHFVYFDLPKWARWWKKGTRGVQLYYYLWQLGVYFVASRLHKTIGFELVHHATFVKYWAPSFLSLLSLPFIWGPVGGGESAPTPLWADFGIRGRAYERLRDFARWLGEHDPFVRITARRTKLGIATTRDTAARLEFLGLRNIKVIGESGLTLSEIQELSSFPQCNAGPIRFITMSRLLHWKGIHIGLRAFKQADLPSSEYWIVGDGPDRKRLEELVHDLQIDKRVRFFGTLRRQEALEKLSICHILVHPSLHDSGGWVCIEGMAAGRPVICLDIGGPSTQVTEMTGIKIRTADVPTIIPQMADAMKKLATDSYLRLHLGNAGRERVMRHFTWEEKAKQLSTLYNEVVLEGK